MTNADIVGLVVAMTNLGHIPNAIRNGHADIMPRYVFVAAKNLLLMISYGVVHATNRCHTEDILEARHE